MPKVPTIKSLQYFRNEMLDYPDFWFGHKPPSYRNNFFHMSIKDLFFFFFFENGVKDRGPVIMLSCF